jgi:hypothetical protein
MLAFEVEREGSLDGERRLRHIDTGNATLGCYLEVELCALRTLESTGAPSILGDPIAKADLI